MANDAFYKFLLVAFQNIEAVMADDASIYIFHSDTEGLNFRRAFADAGFFLLLFPQDIVPTIMIEQSRVYKICFMSVWI